MVILPLLFLFLAAALPALIWIVFFLREDLHPEPKKLIFYIFCLGGLISLPTLLVQTLFQHFVIALPWGGIILIVGLAAFEEIFKFLAAYLGIHKNPALDEPVDAMIYMITAAMGFATIENLFIVGNSFDVANLFSVTSVLNVLAIRSVGATLLHALGSSLVGYYWAKGLINGTLKKSIITGLLLATLVHAFFNYLVLVFQNYNLIYPSVFLIFVAFFVFNDFERLRSRPERL